MFFVRSLSWHVSRAVKFLRHCVSSTFAPREFWIVFQWVTNIVLVYSVRRDPSNYWFLPRKDILSRLNELFLLIPDAILDHGRRWKRFVRWKTRKSGSASLKLNDFQKRVPTPKSFFPINANFPFPFFLPYESYQPWGDFSKLSFSSEKVNTGQVLTKLTTWTLKGCLCWCSSYFTRIE